MRVYRPERKDFPRGDKNKNHELGTYPTSKVRDARERLQLRRKNARCCEKCWLAEKPDGGGAKSFHIVD